VRIPILPERGEKQSLEDRPPQRQSKPMSDAFHDPLVSLPHNGSLLRKWVPAEKAVSGVLINAFAQPVFYHSHLHPASLRAYNSCYMARGWESKSVEDQISQKENPNTSTGNSKITRKEAVRREKRDGLVLARTRTMSDLQSARDARYKALLERTLAHLNNQLAELERS
jgi:hypothetical protein